MKTETVICGGVDSYLNVFGRQSIGHHVVRQVLHGDIKCFNYKNGLALWYEQPDQMEIEEVDSYLLKEFGIELVVHKTAKDWEEQRAFVSSKT